VIARYRRDEFLGIEPPPGTLPQSPSTVAVCTRDRPEDLERYLEEARGLEYADLSLAEYRGEMKGIERLVYRMLGLTTDVEGGAVHVLTNKDCASVTFLDEDHNELQVVESDSQGPMESVAFVLENGQRTESPRSDCIPVARAFDAVRHLFEHGKRPKGLRYRKGSAEA
jgi:hypothetical protein